MLHEQGGGGALCSPGAECQRGGRRAGLPLRHPFSPTAPSPNCAAPPAPEQGHGDQGGVPKAPLMSGGGGAQGMAGAPSPSRLQGHFVFPPKDKGQ